MSDGTPLRPGKWWVTCRARGRLISTAGLMRTLVWWSTFKTMALRDWMVLSDRFGIPYVTGEYDENIADEDKEVLRQAVADLGSDGFAIFSQMASGCAGSLQSLVAACRYSSASFSCRAFLVACSPRS